MTITVNDSYLPDPTELLVESAHVRQASRLTTATTATATTISAPLQGRAAPHNAMLPAAAVIAAAETKARAAAEDDDHLSLNGSMTTLSTVSEGELERRLLEIDVDLDLMKRLRRPSRAQPLVAAAAATAVATTTTTTAAAAAPQVAPTTAAKATTVAAGPVLSAAAAVIAAGVEEDDADVLPITGREAILRAIEQHRAASEPVIPEGAILAPIRDEDTGFFRVITDPEEQAAAPDHWRRLRKPEYVLPPTYSEHVKHRYNQYRIDNGLVPIANYDLGAFSDELETRILPDGRRYLDVAILL